MITHGGVSSIRQSIVAAECKTYSTYLILVTVFIFSPASPTVYLTIFGLVYFENISFEFETIKTELCL